MVDLCEFKASLVYIVSSRPNIVRPCVQTAVDVTFCEGV